MPRNVALFGSGFLADGTSQDEVIRKLEVNHIPIKCGLCPYQKEACRY